MHSRIQYIFLEVSGELTGELTSFAEILAWTKFQVTEILTGSNKCGTFGFSVLIASSNPTPEVVPVGKEQSFNSTQEK